MLPLIFKKFGYDPGDDSSPFVVTFVDVTAIGNRNLLLDGKVRLLRGFVVPVGELEDCLTDYSGGGDHLGMPRSFNCFS